MPHFTRSLSEVPSVISGIPKWRRGWTDLDGLRRCGLYEGLMTETGVREEPADDPESDEHLSDVEAGAGCTEIWEHLSKRRAECADAN